VPRVFTIPASVPFLPTLLRALRDGRLVPGFPTTADPLELATATLYLPTRRACHHAGPPQSGERVTAGAPVALDALEAAR